MLSQNCLVNDLFFNSFRLSVDYDLWNYDSNWIMIHYSLIVFIDYDLRIYVLNDLNDTAL